jgi:hypothetical protein
MVPFAGNGLIVFPEAASLSTQAMQVLTQEMRQYNCTLIAKIDTVITVFDTSVNWCRHKCQNSKFFFYFVLDILP